MVFRTHCTAVFVTPDVKNGRNNQKVPEKLILLRAVLVSQVNPASPPSLVNLPPQQRFLGKRTVRRNFYFFLFFISVQIAIIVLYVDCQQVFLYGYRRIHTVRRKKTISIPTIKIITCVCVG